MQTARRDVRRFKSCFIGGKIELYEHIDDEDETKVIRLLINAFYEMCSGSSEVHAQCKPNVKITPEKIVDILPFDKWQ